MNFVSREQWGARPPSAAYTTIYSTSCTGHWEGPTMGNFPHSACDDKVQGIQAYHMDNNGWSDIAYNALVCPHGYVFEGRGIGHRSAANGTNPGNDQSYAICFLGGTGDTFTDAAKQAFVDAANWLGQPLNHGHRDWYNTECPGNEIYNWIHAGHPLTPTPTETHDMGPAVCIATDNTPWYFTIGTDGQVWANAGGDDNNFWSIGGANELDANSGPDAACQSDGTIIVTARGRGGDVRVTSRNPKNGKWGSWWSMGGK